METVETLVIGAGVIGLTVAQELANYGHEVFVCEKERTAGSGVSARNSGVIHAGIYYPPGSLKSRLCQQGRDMLYAFCETHGVPYRQTGKLIVACDNKEEALLKGLLKNAQAAGVNNLDWLGAQAVEGLEPSLSVQAALLSPSTGIVDPAQFVAALERGLCAAGGHVAFGSEVRAIQPTGSGFIVSFAEDAGETLFVKKLVNCAGLGAQTVASCIVGFAKEYIPPLRMVRGHYFSLAGKTPFTHLIYPVPAIGGLGVHATLDMTGTVRFGPDVEPVDREDYCPDDGRMPAFKAAISRYFPGIAERTLTPDYVGIRPQVGELGAFNDFRISSEAEHGIKGLVNLFGIESPGLTSALAIAKHVADLIES